MFSIRNMIRNIISRPHGSFTTQISKDFLRESSGIFAKSTHSTRGMNRHTTTKNFCCIEQKMILQVVSSYKYHHGDSIANKAAYKSSLQGEPIPGVLLEFLHNSYHIFRDHSSGSQQSYPKILFFCLGDICLRFSHHCYIQQHY